MGTLAGHNQHGIACGAGGAVQQGWCAQLAKEKNVHSGHRERMKQRFMNGGLKEFSEHEVLELLLFYAIPQGNVNELAHTLLDTFGTIAGVLNATPEALRAIAGVGEHTVTLFKLLPGLFARYQLSQQDATGAIDNRWAARRLLEPYFYGARDELVLLLCLDAKRKVLGVRQLQLGTVNAVDISSRRVLENALSLNAATVILAHNHPSGNALPSPDDIATTRQLSETLKRVDITLWDHFIFADNDMVSMRESNLI